MSEEDDIINAPRSENSQEDPKNIVTIEHLLDDVRSDMDAMQNSVQSDINAMQSNLSKIFEESKNSILAVDEKKYHFISKNTLWDMWFQKLFAQIISVKVWVMVLITVLLVAGIITSVEFASLFGIIMGFKGAFSVAEVWKNTPTEIENKSIFRRV